MVRGRDGGHAGAGHAHDRLTDAALAYPDAATTAFSLVAQWLLARKRLESWAFWIGVDVLAIGVYAAKGLYITCGLYAVFLGLAVAGLATWRRVAVPPEAPPEAAPEGAR